MSKMGSSDSKIGAFIHPKPEAPEGNNVVDVPGPRGEVWVTRRNEHPHPAGNGADQFVAHALEYPGLLAFGPTAEAARANAIAMAEEERADSPREHVRRRHAVMAQVQFNHRITAEEKARIAERAEEAGFSVRQFMLNQCLRAEIWRERTPATPADRARVR